LKNVNNWNWTFNNYFGFGCHDDVIILMLRWFIVLLGIGCALLSADIPFSWHFENPSSSTVDNGWLFWQWQRFQVYRHGAWSRNEGNAIWTRNARVPFLANCLATQIDAIHEKVRVTSRRRSSRSDRYALFAVHLDLFLSASL